MQFCFYSDHQEVFYFLITLCGLFPHDQSHEHTASKSDSFVVWKVFLPVEFLNTRFEIIMKNDLVSLHCFSLKLEDCGTNSNKMSLIMVLF